MKSIVFHGTALSDLREFPDHARGEAGYQLDKVQHGMEPSDWKPMKGVGAGVQEIRIRDADGAFRVIYLARLADTVHVLHCFQKKTEKTAPADIALAKKRFRELIGEK